MVESAFRVLARDWLLASPRSAFWLWLGALGPGPMGPGPMGP